MCACACAGFNLNTQRWSGSERPVGLLRQVAVEAADPTPFLQTCEVLVRGGAHVAMSQDPTDMCAPGALYEVSTIITHQRLHSLEEYHREREAAWRADLLEGALKLHDGLLLNATLRNQLGRGDQYSPLGSWAAYVDRMVSDHPTAVPGVMPPSWPGAALMLSAVITGVTYRMDKWYEPEDYQPRGPEPLRVEIPSLVAWIWGRALPLVVSTARHASWRRRRAAVVAAKWGAEEA
jgi:hypothetical protein